MFHGGEKDAQMVGFSGRLIDTPMLRFNSPLYNKFGHLLLKLGEMQPNSQKKQQHCACFCECKRRNKNYMDLKDFMSGGWKLTAREPTPRLKEERLPAYIPLNKPTRDISASNKSHSLTHDDFQLAFPASERRNILLDRHIEDYEYEKQANIIFNRQFKALAKLLGDETMEFDELKQGIEKLILRDIPQPDPTLVDRIHSLERQLGKRTKFAQMHGKSGNSPIANNLEYVKSLQSQLDKKSKRIAELSDSINRETFQEVVRNLQQEMAEKNECLNKAQQEKLDLRSRTAAQISALEAEVIKLAQFNKKLTMEVQALNRKSQSFAEEKQRAELREKELTSSFQSETKVVYKGFSYTVSTLLLQLESRDQQLAEMQGNLQQRDQQRTKIRNELSKMKQSQRKNQAMIEQLTAQKTEHQIYLNKYREEIEEQKRELETERSENESIWQELQRVNGQLAQTKQHVEQLKGQQNKLRRAIDNLTESIQSHEQTQKDQRLERQRSIKAISDLQNTLNEKLKTQCDLQIHISAIEKEIAAVEEEKSEMQQQFAEIEHTKEQQIEDYKQKLEQVDKERNELIDQLEGISQSVTQLKEHIEYLQDQLRQREEQNEAFLAQINQLQQEIEEKNEQIRNVEVKNTNKQNQQDREIQDYKEKLSEQNQTISHLQGQLNQSIKHIEYYRTLEVEITKLNDLAHKKITQISQDKRENQRAIDSLMEQKEQIRQKWSSIQNLFEILEEQLKREHEQNEEERSQKQELQYEIKRLQQNSQQVADNLQHLAEQNNQLTLRIQREQNERCQIVKDLQEKVATFKQSITSITKESSSKHEVLVQQVENYKIQISTLEERCTLQQRALNQIKLERQDLLKKISLSQSTICQTSFSDPRPITMQIHKEQMQESNENKNDNHRRQGSFYRKQEIPVYSEFMFKQKDELTIKMEEIVQNNTYQIETINSLTSQIKSYEAQFTRFRDEAINRETEIQGIKRQSQNWRIQIEDKKSEIALYNQRIQQLEENLASQQKQHQIVISSLTEKMKTQELQLEKQFQKSKQSYEDFSKIQAQNNYYKQSISEYQSQVQKYKIQITQFIEKQQRQRILQLQKQKNNENSSISDNKSKQKDPGSGSKSIDEIRQSQKGLDPSKISGQQSKIPTILKNLYKSQLDKLAENSPKPQTDRSDPKYAEQQNNRLSSISNSSKRSIANSLNPPNPQTNNIVKQETKQAEILNRQQYLPQHSSKRGNLANTINFVVQPRPSPSSQNEIHTSDFQRHIYTNNAPPIYIARPSMLIQQQSIERKESQSNSTGKQKIKISYGKSSLEKSIQMKPNSIIKEPKPQIEMKKSQVTSSMPQQIQRKKSQQSISFRQSKLEQSDKDADINRVKFSRPSSQINNFHSSRVQPFQQPNSSSIINAIIEPQGVIKSFPNSDEPQKQPIIYQMTQTFGKLNDQLQPSTTAVYFSPAKYAQHFPRQESHFLKAGRVEIIPSISADTLTSIKLAETSKSTPIPIQEEYYPRESAGVVRNSKIAMRSVAGSRRSSQYQYAQQKPREDERDRLSSISSQDSGIQILQQEWMPPCCLQE